MKSLPLALFVLPFPFAFGCKSTEGEKYALLHIIDAVGNQSFVEPHSGTHGVGEEGLSSYGFWVCR